MAAMLKDGRHLEFLIGTHTFKKSKECQLSAGLLLILFRIMA